MKHALYALLGSDLAAVQRELADVRTMPLNGDVRRTLAALEQMEQELQAETNPGTASEGVSGYNPIRELNKCAAADNSAGRGESRQISLPLQVEPNHLDDL